MPRWFCVPLFGALLTLAPGSAMAEPDPPAAAPVAPSAFPWLGVSMDMNGGDTGVRVDHVVKGSPAERGGVRSGDRIVSVDGTRVTTPRQVTGTVATHKVGETMAVGLERMGTAISASVVLAPRPTSDDLLKMDLVGAPAPAWSKAIPVGSAPASITALRGRVVLIDFWATWCGPCRLIAPRLSALKDRLGAQGLSVVGLTTDEAEPAAVFAEKHQMRYPIVVDSNGDTSRAYGITGLPTMILVDKKGIIRDVFIGFDPGSEARIEIAIKKLLAEPAPPYVPPPAVPRPDSR